MSPGRTAYENHIEQVFQKETVNHRMTLGGTQGVADASDVNQPLNFVCSQRRSSF